MSENFSYLSIETVKKIVLKWKFVELFREIYPVYNNDRYETCRGIEVRVKWMIKKKPIKFTRIAFMMTLGSGIKNYESNDFYKISG